MVFTFVLLLGNALKEILPLLVNRQVTLAVVARGGRFAGPVCLGVRAADGHVDGHPARVWPVQRRPGIDGGAGQRHQPALADQPDPVVQPGAVRASALVNMEIGPRCRVAYNNILFNMRLELTGAQVPEGRLHQGFPGLHLHVDKNRGGELEDVKVWV